LVKNQKFGIKIKKTEFWSKNQNFGKIESSVKNQNFGQKIGILVKE